MAQYTRGEFLGLGAALVGAFAPGEAPRARQTAAAPSAAPLPSAEPDLVVVNGRVLTSDAALPRAQAFAVKNGRFVAVGSTADVRHLATARTTSVDAQQMTVVPGFIDAHSHPSGMD
jgi:adenine deaminase